MRHYVGLVKAGVGTKGEWGIETRGSEPLMAGDWVSFRHLPGTRGRLPKWGTRPEGPTTAYVETLVGSPLTGLLTPEGAPSKPGLGVSTLLVWKEFGSVSELLGVGVPLPGDRRGGVEGRHYPKSVVGNWVTTVTGQGAGVRNQNLKGTVESTNGVRE